MNLYEGVAKYYDIEESEYQLSIPIKMSTFFGNSEHPFPEK